jgi:hypothetical protein
MSRFYTINIQGTSFTATADLFNVAATSGMMFKLHQLEINAVSQTAVQELTVSIKRMTATVSNGTGGSSFTPLPFLSTDAASTITARVSDATTRATTSGSTSYLFPLAWNVLNGLIWVPAPEYRPSFSISQNLIIGLETAPSASLTTDAYIIVEELG